LKSAAYIVVLLAAGMTAFCGLEIRDGERIIKLDPPCVAPPENGNIAGTISAGKYALSTIEACCRDTSLRYKPVFWNTSDGRFEFAGLPGDAIYDIRVTTADGSIFEGADMSMPDWRLEELAAARRDFLNMPQQPLLPFTISDAEEITKLVSDTKGFADITRVMIIKGHGRFAAALVELIRTGRVAGVKSGNVIWRTDIWYFERTGNAWRRMDNQERTIERLVTEPSKLAGITAAFDPKMNVKIENDGSSKTAYFTLSDSPNPSASRLAGSELQLNTKPIIME